MCIRDSVQVANAVRARHRAELAADALRLVDLHGAVLGLVRGARRAHLHAFGVDVYKRQP